MGKFFNGVAPFLTLFPIRYCVNADIEDLGNFRVAQVFRIFQRRSIADPRGEFDRVWRFRLGFFRVMSPLMMF